MDYQTFVRKPFLVEGVEVTNDNMAELAEMVGDGKIRHKDNGEPYFLSDRRIIRSVARVELGYWVTKMDDHFRVYKPSVFDGLFWVCSPVLTQLVNLMHSHEEVVADGV